VLKLISGRGAPVQLEQLGSVEGESPSLSKSCTLLTAPGRPIGSVFIDRAIHKLIATRLTNVEGQLSQPAGFVAWKMLSGRFQRLKCAFGTEAARTPYLSLEVPFLKESGADLPAAGIQGGNMQIGWLFSCPLSPPEQPVDRTL
jgi:hypothetical protein